MNDLQMFQYSVMGNHKNTIEWLLHLQCAFTQSTTRFKEEEEERF
jgi:hypothetical protein